ncbi:catalase-domain-containing protein [Amniculicola lignicola CBS 123094]|uniref:Catalase-domain-containing protein n=1 Tax=Amniculicola lignicola CBS 123094 TaxID=1392246 RepID=A0A6A5WT32_9PLEO|nr:catalase-domain-containing protein [Amniculicola lignicola CBS 123094]
MGSISTNRPLYTLAEGRPIADPTTQTALRGSTQRGGGLALLSDTQLIETLAHYPRERIPERVVHAKAAGAFGEFEVTHDITDITSADFLSEVGKKTKVLMRISTVGGEKGSADTVRDVRGWAMKLFTDEGNWDLVGNDLPVFFIRDPIKFPSLNRSHKKHPQTNIPDASMFWDYHNMNLEGMHAIFQLFGQRGIPASLRNINGFGIHTYKLGKPDGSFKYVKFHFKPDAGIKTFTEAEAAKIAGEDPDHHVRDLYEAIAAGNFPTWTMSIQVMDLKDAETYRFNIFDPTKTWPLKDYPLQAVGKLTLNKNPDNYFADVEQAAFSPSTLVPGIGPSADLLLQARMFSYPDAARYRVGTNYQQLPVNKAKYVYSPFQRDGAGTINGNYGADPSYVRSTAKPLNYGPMEVAHDKWVGEVTAWTSEVTDEDFVQPRELWTMFKEQGADEEFITNVAGNLSKATKDVQAATVRSFALVDEEISQRLEKALKERAAAK